VAATPAAPYNPGSGIPSRPLLICYSNDSGDGNYNIASSGNLPAWKANVQGFEAKVGANIDGYQCFCGTEYNNPPTAQGMVNAAYDYAQGFAWAQTNGVPLGVMLTAVELASTANGASSSGNNAALQATAGGAWDSYYQGVVQQFAQAGCKTLYVRVQWEENGGWYVGWQGYTAAYQWTDWIAAFQHVYGVLKAAGTANGIVVKVIWNPDAIASSGGYVPGAYPGDAYVDLLGLDFYSSYIQWGSSQISTSAAKATAWDTADGTSSGVLTPAPTDGSSWGWGMLDHIAFAKAHGKPICFPETGDGPGGAPHGITNDPAFPSYMASRIAQAQASGVPVEFWSIWDGSFDLTWDMPSTYATAVQAVVNSTNPGTSSGSGSGSGSGVTYAGPVLDGVAMTPATGVTGSPVTLTLSTVHTNDLIVLAGQVDPDSATGSSPITSVTDTARLAWARRAQTGGAENVELWYATATTPLSGDVITVSASGALPWSVLCAFGLNGGASGVAFGETTAVLTGNGPGAITAPANSFVLGTYAFNNTQTPAPTGGFSSIMAQGWTVAEYQQVTSAVASLAVPCTTTDQLAGILETFVLASSAPTPPPPKGITITPVASVTALLPTVIGVSGTLSGYAAPPALQYSFSGSSWLALPSGAVVSSGQFSFPLTFSTAGTYTLYVQDTSGTVGTSNVFTVTAVTPPPPPTPTGPLTFPLTLASSDPHVAGEVFAVSGQLFASNG
jgi:hypothetical protein